MSSRLWCACFARTPVHHSIALYVRFSSCGIQRNLYSILTPKFVFTFVISLWFAHKYTSMKAFQIRLWGPTSSPGRLSAKRPWGRGCMRTGLDYFQVRAIWSELEDLKWHLIRINHYLKWGELILIQSNYWINSPGIQYYHMSKIKQYDLLVWI